MYITYLQIAQQQQSEKGIMGNQAKYQQLLRLGEEHMGVHCINLPTCLYVQNIT
jgi:chromosome condensin MukBEF MukE localization factor